MARAKNKEPKLGWFAKAGPGLKWPWLEMALLEMGTGAKVALVGWMAGPWKLLVALVGN